MRMFKRKLLKRALPVILSVAMILQSTPATALAAEDMETKTVEAQTQSADSSDSSDAKASDNSKESEETAAPDDASADNASKEQTPNEQAAGEQKTEEPKNEESVSKEEQDNNNQTEANTTVETNSEDSRTEEPKTDESKTQESNIQEPETEDSNSEKSEENNSDNTQEEDTVNSSEEQSTLEGTEVDATATEVEAEENASEALNNTSAEQTTFDTKIEIVNGSTLRNAINKDLEQTEKFLYKDDVKELTFTATYQEEDNRFKGIIGKINGQYNNKNVIDIFVDGENKTETLKDGGYIHYTWQKLEGENFVDLADLPSDAGKYRLKITVEAVDGLCSAVDSYIIFEVEKAELQIKLNSTNNGVILAEPAATVKEFVDNLTKTYTLLNGTNKIEDTSAIVSAFTASVYEVDSEGNVAAEAMTAEKTFRQKQDYRLKIVIALVSDADKNYKVALEDYYAITIGDLKETEVVVTLVDAGKELTELYGTKVTIDDTIVPALVKENPVQVITRDAEGAAKKIEDAQVTAAWYTREQTGQFEKDDEEDDEEDWERESHGSATEIEESYILYENGYKYIKCESDPVESGEYYAIYLYNGDNEQCYQKSVSDPIKVTIEPVPIIIVPESIRITSGMNYTDIEKLLSKATYKIYNVTADGKIGTEFTEAGEDFFGVSYYDTNLTQYYQPVFELQQRIIPVSKDEKTDETVEAKWESFDENDTIMVSDSEKTIEYRIRFTGDKAVFAADGRKGYWIGRWEYDDDYPYWEEEWVDGAIPITDTTTNSADKNHLVKADKDTLDANAVILTLDQATETSIDTSAIISAFQGAADENAKGTLENPLWKIYNDTPLFAKRADYKQAKVNGANVSSTDANLEYTWQYVPLYQYENVKKGYKELDEDQKKEYASIEEYLKRNLSWYSGLGDINDYDEDEFGDTDNEDGNFISGRDANVYRLHITYTDDEYKNLSSEADVYFMVKKQEVYIAAEEQRAQYGDSVQRFTGRGCNIYLIPENDETKLDLAAAEKPDWDIDEYNKLQWNVRRLEKDVNGANLEGQYISLPNGNENTFVKIENVEAEKQYYYEAYATFNSSNYTSVDQDKTANADVGKTEYHFSAGKINFNGEKELEIIVDPAKLPADRPYNAKYAFPADENGMLPIPEGLIKIIDKTAPQAEQDKTAALLNTSAEYNKDLVNIEWVWTDKKGNFKDTVQTQNILYGGIYSLQISFAGNSEYQRFSGNLGDEIYSFEITPLDVEITPIVNQESKAGDFVSKLFKDDAVEQAFKTLPEDIVPEEDKWLFTYFENNQYKDYRGVKREYEGYAIFESSDNSSVRTLSKNAYIGSSKKLISNIDRTYLRYGEDYFLRYGYKRGTLTPQWATSYNVTFQYSDAFVPAHGNAWVDESSFGSKSDNSVKIYYTQEDKDGAMIHTIMPREGIPFVYAEDYKGFCDIDDNLIPLDKNYIAYRIYAPKEYAGNTNGNNFDQNKKSFIYKNNINAAGGYVLTDWTPDKERIYNEDYEEYETIYFYDRQYIVVLFPVVKDSSGSIQEIKPFPITWENGYTETFKLDLSNVQLEANLKKAVVPKSLAFNGVNSKMAVGETQQLDVKITKAQLADIVQIRYRLENGESKNDFVSINPETGNVTALKADKAAVTIEAYPVYRAEDGTLQPITGKGVKVAKTKITVTDVTAPVIKKVEVQDTFATVQFTLPENGYRREIYVVKANDKTEAKSWTKDKFDQAIADIKNGHWKDTFAIQPIYTTGKAEYNNKLKLVVKTLTGFNANCTYVIYVRNVSAVRTLADGSKVTLSANGTIKSFVTTKSQVEQLVPYFVVNENNEADKKNTVTYKVENGKPVSGEYTIDFFAKTAQLSVNGFYREKNGGNDAAELKDLLKYTLPIKDKTLLSSYLNPKLIYGIFDYVYGSWQEDEYENNIFVPKDPWIHNVEPSKYATINNKGKITLKGVDIDGEKDLYVYVKAENGKFAYCKLTVTVKADTVTGKKAKLKVGDTIKLSDYLEYKQGKKKIPNYRSSKIEITNETIIDAANRGIHIEKDGIEWKITAVSPSSSAFSVNFTDKDCDNQQINVTVPVVLTSTQIDPVKGLKAAYADDKNITLNFKHTSKAEQNDDIAFDIEVKDARGDVVFKKLAWKKDIEIVAKDEDNYRQKQQQWIYNKYESYYAGEDEDENPIYRYKNVLKTNKLVYYEKTKTYAYTISSSKLVRLSAYSISVTPVYKDQKALKAATIKTKTTNIPAARGWNIDAMNSDNYYGGISILASKGYYLGSPLYLTSGNSYTLRASCDNDAKDRVTDTLTWKSSNTKVASVKANAGTYTATFKALQQGTTTITVTSKITKKVIARYLVRVKAVGKGAAGYGGDYEQTWDEDFYKDVLSVFDPYYEGKLEVLTLSNKVVVNADNGYNRTWVSFTAPSFGEYTFKVTSDENQFEYDYSNRTFEVYDSQLAGGKMYYSEDSLLLEAGQKIYLKIEGKFALTAEGSAFDKITLSNNKENPLDVKNEKWISFTAPEKNYYTFYSNLNIAQVRRNNRNEYVFDDKYGISLEAGETILIRTSSGKLWVDYRNTSANPQLTTDKAVDVTLIKENATQYVSFTAPATAKYAFTAKGAKATFYELGSSAPLQNDDKVFATGKALAVSENPGEESGKEDEIVTSIELTIEKDTTIVVQFAAEESSFTKDKDKIDASVSVTMFGTQELKAGTSVTVAAKTTEFITFKVPENSNPAKYIFRTDNNIIIKGYFDNKGNDITNIVNNGAITVNNTSAVKAGDTIYLETENINDKDNGNISVTAIEITAVTAGKPAPITITDGGEYWFTFTAAKEGYYVFTKLVTSNGEGKASHDIGLYESTPFNADDEKELGALKKMKIGEKIIFVVRPTESVGDAAVTTAATIAVNPVTVTPLTLGKESTVALNEKDGVSYYVFTAAVEDDYTFTWNPDKESGTANVVMGSDLTNLYNSVGGSEYMYAGNVRYIKVTQTSDKKVDGKLKITSDNSDSIVLTSGKNVNFDVKAGETVSYRFTVPKKAELGYIVTASTNEKEGKKPEITVACGTNYNSIDGKEMSGSQIYMEVYDYENNSISNGWKVGKTYQLTITASEDAAGSIIIQPIAATALDADKADQKVTNMKPIWYRFEVPETGRYIFDSTLAENSSAQVVRKKIQNIDSNSYSWNGSSGEYFEKGDMVYAKAYTDAETEQSFTIKKPVKITPTPITLDANGEAEVKLEDKPEVKQTVAYYAFTAPEAAHYAFEGSGYSVEKLVPVEGNSYCPNNGTQLAKDEGVFVTIYKGDTFKVTKKAVTALKNGVESAEVTLKTNETAYFSYQVYEQGMYTFKASSDKSLSASVDKGNSIYANSANGFYLVQEFTGNNKVMLSVTNSNVEETKFKVTVTKVVPTVLNLNEEKPITVKKNELEWITFKASEKARYKFTSGNANVQLQEKNGSSGSNEKVLEKTDDAVIYRLSFTGEGDSAQAKAKVTTVNAAALPANGTFKVPANDTTWFTYTADKAAVYVFALKQGDADAAFALFQSITDNTALGGITQWIEKDGKILLRVVNNTDKELEYKLTVTIKEPVKNETLQFTSSYETQTINFEVPETGTYKIIGYTMDKGQFNVRYNKNNMSLGSFYVYDYNSDRNNAQIRTTRLLTKGDTIEISVESNRSGSHHVTIIVELDGTPILLTDKVEETYRLAPNGYMYFEYTAASDTMYSFALNGNYISCSMADENGEFNQFFGTKKDIMLQSGETVLLEVRNTYNSETEFTLKVNPPIQLTNIPGVKTYILPQNMYNYFEFAAEKDGIYNFSFTSQDSSSWCYYTDENGEWNQSFSSNNAKTFNMKSGEKILLRIQSYSGEPECTWKIGIPTQLTGEVEETYQLEYGYTYFEYTAAEDGNYIISFTGKNTNPCSYADGNGNFNASFYNDKNFTMKAGEKLFLRVYAYSEESECILKVKMPDKISGDVKETGSLMYQESVYYVYTVKKDARYDVNVNGLDGYYTDEDGNYNSFDEKCFQRKAGEEILLKITNYYSNDEAKEYTLEIKEISADPVTTSNEESGTLKPSENIYFEYTAEKETQYTVVTSGNINCEYVNKNGDFDYYSDNYIFDMEIGEKLLFRLQNKSDNVLQYTFAVKELSIKELPETTEETKYTIPSESNECYLEYTVIENGIYTFTINGENISSYYSSESGNFINSFTRGEKTFSLESGNRFFIKIIALGSNPSTEFTIQIKKENPDNFASLIVDEEKSLEFTSKSQVEWLSMQIPEDGSYRITGSNEDGASFYMEQLKDNSYNNPSYVSANGKGSLYIYDLQAGDYIYFKVYPNNSSSSEETFQHTVTILAEKY